MRIIGRVATAELSRGFQATVRFHFIRVASATDEVPDLICSIRASLTRRIALAADRGLKPTAKFAVPLRGHQTFDRFDSSSGRAAVRIHYRQGISTELQTMLIPPDEVIEIRDKELGE